jgi:hypothetical protein
MFSAPLSPALPSRAVFALLLILSFGIAAACSSTESDTPATTTPVAETAPLVYVSTLPEMGAALAIATGTTKAADGTAEAMAYVCDGVSISTWFFGTEKGGVIDATSADGSSFQGTVSGASVTGNVTLSMRASIDFTAPKATGVAGIYLIEHIDARREGYSGERAHLVAEVTSSDALGDRLSGTVTPVDGAPIPLSGTAKSFGSGDISTWIVQSDGSVVGTTSDRDGLTGGGNCSLWQKIKSLMFGVYCSYLSR